MMEKDYIEVKSFGKVFPKKGANARIPYEHQKCAMENLDIMNKNAKYSTMIVLPTGGGKTYTASMWLLRNALDQKKKILWIAHRQMLLDQAAESFQKFAYSEVIPHIPSFQYRIISGASTHDRTIDIQPTDNLLIMSKDIDNADILMDDEVRRFINFEFSNQYMLFLRNCDGLNVSDKSFKVMKFKSNRITLEEEL